ncbi:hypothetical protein OBBRIDRAFT_806699 [Obba rivulosa]|uniref:Uncharacterized protein n=1 Tax=Obba rivulosa TaxID=1052685 RepID=A0A8E2DH01_9APHY|nr:hypothetical protein OBBRIDRAFT_806699 [Obba rivulosa]
MYTCSTLYVAGVLEAYAKIYNFPYIGDVVHLTLDILVKVLTHAHAPASIAVDFKDDEIEARQIANTLATMKGVRSLCWRDRDELGIATISRMQSPVINLNVDFWSHQDKFNPAPMLTGVASTLETPELFYMEFEPCIRNLVLHDAFQHVP